MSQASPGPEGSWAAQVHRPLGTSSVVVHFTPQGQAFLLSGGSGRWWRDRPGRFRFSVAEAMVNQAGGFSGWVRIEQEAVLEPDQFTSQGTSSVHGEDGALAYDAEVTIVARRAA